MTIKTILHILVWGGGIYLFLNLYAFVVSDNLIFSPQPSSYRHLPNEVEIEVVDGEHINAVFLETPGAKHTILFSHGNAEDLSSVVPFMQQFHQLGYSVLMYDYRGYGTSEGQASTAHAKQDVVAAYHWLVNVKKIDPKTIISHGRSLGGGVAVWLAAHHEVGGLITESSFASAFRVRTHWKMLPWDKFDSLKSIRRVQCPVLVIHGRDDQVIPFWHGRKIYAAAAAPKQHLWIDQGKHDNYAYVAGDEYINAIQRFVHELVDSK